MANVLTDPGFLVLVGTYSFFVALAIVFTTGDE